MNAANKVSLGDQSYQYGMNFFQSLMREAEAVSETFEIHSILM